MERFLLRDSSGEILPQFRHWVVGSKWGSPLHERKRGKGEEGLLDHVFFKVLGSDYRRPKCQIGRSESLHHYANLFVWSVLAGKFGFALFLLEQPSLKYPMAAALVACNVLRKTVKAGKVATTCEGLELEERARQFEKIACNMLMTCYECSQYRTLFLAVQSIPAFGGFSCLQLALDGKCLDFFSLDPVQDHLTRLWYHKLSPQSSWSRIGLACFVPIAAGKILTFEEKKDEEEDTKLLIWRHPKIKDDLRCIGIDSGGEWRG